ncbi:MULTISPECIES: uracil-DNA glycosylase [unclassified Tolypothrix]|uniref:uracil-DNA glycosylase n=1 Tax=unclassified Tolypothrix TaxID=2649714 RepID=UPI0005EAC160|nr:MULTISPECIES: uracil-DNA glycosylase [unclassified Tolypothrix]BAY92497.1 uracil-DNA glycosylase [Microchaete diplosiphon NIES-3275]EKF05551.1 uracil-DNA glycosylase [Tolypothrix sp. PCC 7601]MBE9082603.1 uracil-DNA glycosylase [Tolypothrix sp. LEGE 11397]UYD26454.1 uracil-DNA glycosylase [Tolypothrix sp. PCC 7712]UYD31308.1 uracil-DNA glycosylase [Tolypothrix sp. PCC 7601]
MTHIRLSPSWQTVLAEEFDKPYFSKLQNFLLAERQSYTIYPPEEQIFSAFELTPYENVNVFLLGQDPYHDQNQAHGLCFSVQPGIKPPPSLINIFKELKDDVGFEIPNHGYLVSWAKQGILMLNAVLTVRAHTPNSHKNQGWETFTDAVISKVNQKLDPVVFVLWGGYAQKKLKLIDTKRHTVIQSAHPSPLSARNGFFGSKPFSAINSALRSFGKPEIDWQIPDL